MPHFRGKPAGRETNAYRQGGVEPPLEEVLRDPLVRLVMARDRVQVDDLLRVVAAARRPRTAAEGLVRRGARAGEMDEMDQAASPQGGDP